MGDTEKPAVSDEAKRKLAEVFQHEAGFSWWEGIYNDPEKAMFAVESVIEAGWGPVNG